MSLEDSAPLSHNSIENNEKAAVAISDVNDTFLFYAEVRKLSLNRWFKLNVTKLNLSTNSLMTFLFFLLKLYSEVSMMSVLYALSMVGKNFWLDSPSPAQFLSSRC